MLIAFNHRSDNTTMVDFDPDGEGWNLFPNGRNEANSRVFVVINGVRIQAFDVHDEWGSHGVEFIEWRANENRYEHNAAARAFYNSIASGAEMVVWLEVYNAQGVRTSYSTPATFTKA